MTQEKANNVLQDIARAIHADGCRNAKQAKQSAKRYAYSHGLKVKMANPMVVYEPGSERVILLSVKPNGGIHMDIAVSPAYALLDVLGDVIIQ